MANTQLIETCSFLNPAKNSKNNPIEKDVENRFNDFFINTGENLRTDIPTVSPSYVSELN